MNRDRNAAFREPLIRGMLETVGDLTRAMLQRYTHPASARKQSALETFDRVLVDAVRAEHTMSTRTEDETVVPSEIAEILGKGSLPAELSKRQGGPPVVHLRAARYGGQPSRDREMPSTFALTRYGGHPSRVSDVSSRDAKPSPEMSAKVGLPTVARANVGKREGRLGLPAVALETTGRPAFAKATAGSLRLGSRAEAGGRQEARTPDLRVANAALSQLS